MSIPLKSYGVHEYTQSNSPIALYAEEIQTQGYSIIPNVIDEATLSVLREKMDRIYAQQVQEVAALGALEQINDAWIVRSPLVYDECFLTLATTPIVLQIVEKLLGPFYVLRLQNGIINRPDVTNYQIAWHRDLMFQHFTSSRPLSLSALVCIDEFSRETGGTTLLPCSHKMEAFPSPEYIQAHEVVASAPAGSIIVFDSMVYHRAGQNTSPHVRRAVNHMYTLPFMAQQISLPQSLDGRYADDPFLRKLLGYETEPGTSVTQWRETRFQRQNNA